MKAKQAGVWITVGFLGIVYFIYSGFALAADPHANLQWSGTQECITCHQTEALEIHGAGHYQWKGPALYSINGPQYQGKLDTALNSYCVAILGNWNGCGSCHAGLGSMPAQDVSTAQLQNIDCLVCHQKDYKRIRVNGVFVPDTAKMSITMDQAIQTVHKPVRANCLQCHAKSGGGDNNKRGDIALAHAATTDRNFDVHMATSGAGLNCQQCHATQKHHIAGRGADLRETDYDVKMGCSTSTCHVSKTTATGHSTSDINRHVSRVACQVCHIKSYARNAADTTGDESTETYRDWSIPEWSTSLNRYEPTIVRANNITPEYRFWNGTNWNYNVKEKAIYDADKGTYPTSRPLGGIDDIHSVLYPFKYKKANQPYADTLGVLIALDTSVYFSTGFYATAVQAGLVNMGYASSDVYSSVKTDTYQLITHEVGPKTDVLSCAQCHTSSATQMNLKGLGYVIKGTQATTCTQCHERESLPDYKSLHDKHVKSKQYDCSWCHAFSRPERGLRLPSTSLPDSIAPVIHIFEATQKTSAFQVPVTKFVAADNVGVVGYLLTETESQPDVLDAKWTSSAPTSYTFNTVGRKTLYAWVKDAAGNISYSRWSTIDISIQVGADPGKNSISVAANQPLELMINSTNVYQEAPLQEWLVFTANIQGKSMPLYLLSDKGVFLLTDVIGSLSGYTFSFDADGQTSLGQVVMNEFGLRSGDTFIYAYAYRNQTGEIRMDNVITLVIQ